MSSALAAVFLSVLFAQTAEESPARMVIDFGPVGDSDAWVAAALEESAHRDLAGHRIQIVDKRKIDTRDCWGRRADCLLSRYAGAGIDVVLLGWLDGSALRFEAYEGWLKSRVSRGTIELDRKPSPTVLRRKLVGAVAPFFESGGLLEKKPWIVDRSARRDEAPLASVPFLAGAVLVVLLFLFLPALMSRGSLRELPSWRWTIALAVGLPISVAIATTARPVAGLDWLLPMIGGTAWAWFLLLNLRIALPAVPGLGSIHHRSVGPILFAWCIAALLRLLLLAALYAPFALALMQLSGAAWMILVPLFGLSIHYALLALVDHLSARLDRTLVVGRASSDNRWHPVIRKYFLGYVRRAGLQLDRALLERALFLPGKVKGIAAYGGGLTRPRILVEEPLLELALHPLTDEPFFDEEGNDRGLSPADARGVLLPGGAVAEAPFQSRRDAPVGRKQVRPLLGQNETLLGTILPLPAGESVPLVIDDPDEYSVLRELLTAHYSAFDESLYGEEADDTDPTQKDFLFGGLLRAVGSVHRLDSMFSSLALSLDRWKAPAWTRLFRRPFDVVADGYAALNRGLDHLLQYVYYVETRSEDLLTARADEPALARTSAEILRRRTIGEATHAE